METGWHVTAPLLRAGLTQRRGILSGQNIRKNETTLQKPNNTRETKWRKGCKYVDSTSNGQFAEAGGEQGHEIILGM